MQKISGQSTISIASVTQSDAGTFSCEAENGFTVDDVLVIARATADLTVLSKYALENVLTHTGVYFAAVKSSEIGSAESQGIRIYREILVNMLIPNNLSFSDRKPCFH